MLHLALLGKQFLDPRKGMATSYRSGVGMLLYLLKHSRIDLGNPVRELTTVLKSPTLLAYKEMLMIIKFVLDTATMG